LGEAKVAAQWARDDVRRAEGRIQQLKADRETEQRLAKIARSDGNRVSANAHQQRAGAISTEISELERQLVDLRERATETEKKYLRLRDGKPGR
jgi:hypothetical protein